MASCSGLDWSRMTVLECLSATHRLLSFLLSFRLTSHLHFHPPSQLDHRHKTNCEQITSHPTLTASHYPFFILFVSPFPCTLGNDNRFSAAAAWHSYAPEHSLIHFSLLSLTFFFLFSTFFLNVWHNDNVFTYPSLTPLPLTTGYDYQV